MKFVTHIPPEATEKEGRRVLFDGPTDAYYRSMDQLAMSLCATVHETNPSAILTTYLLREPTHWDDYDSWALYQRIKQQEAQ